MSFDLPKVAGSWNASIAFNFEQRCLVNIKTEQEKLNPDNGLIAVLCDAVRLYRLCEEITQKVEREGEY